MDIVDINLATPVQLAALLDLRPSEVAAVLDARPFANEMALRRVLPGHAAARAALKLPKLDINQAHAADIAARAQVSPSVAKTIADARPHYFMSAIRGIVDAEADIERLNSVYSAPELSYQDKLTGRTVALVPDPSKILLPNLESEDAEEMEVLREFGLSPLQRHAGPRSRVFVVPETESAGDTWAKIKETKFGKDAMPGFRDNRSSERFIESGRCMVQFAPQVPEAAQKSILADLGLRIVERYRTPGMYALLVPRAKEDPAALARAISALHARPEVEFAEPNFIGFDDLEQGGEVALPNASSSAEGLAWNLRCAQIPEAWAHSRGSPNTVIAIIDTGVDEAHPALRETVLDRRPDDDWNFESEEERLPGDTRGHGTFIAGILVGNGHGGISGICPDCKILPLKVPLIGETSAYARRREAILHALDRVLPHQRLVINLSWKTAGDVALIRDAINKAVARGAVVVASAGNWPERENEPHYPSDYPAVISVAATNPNRRRARYSYYGDEVDLSAPGGDGPRAPEGNIVSTLPGGKTGPSFGTSFAAPHVTGIVALLLSVHPQLAPAAVRFALESSAQPIADPGMGRGLVNALGALRAMGAPKGPAAPSSSPPSSAPAAPAGLAIVNSASAEELVQRFGLKPFTARVIVQRRPFADLSAVRGLLGMTPEQYGRIADVRS